MKGVKIIYLLLALALPVSVFLFLKYFGQNQFDVEPLFLETLPAGVQADCDNVYELPYSIPENILLNLSWSSGDSLTLFYFKSDSIRIPALNRIPEEYASAEVHFIELKTESEKPDMNDGKMIEIPGNTSELSQLKKCFLFVDEPNNLLLVDNQRRIRGIYQAENRDEFDRLMLEIKIILKKY